jgi:ureidoacrylate peracid hydrolase
VSEELLIGIEARARPAHSALVVIDMQNDFCADGGYIHRVFKTDMSGNAALAAQITALADAARAASMPVIWVQAIYDRKYLAAPALSKQREAGIDLVCCAEGTWGAAFFGVEPRPGEPVVQKHRYSAFFDTALERLLRERAIRTVVLAGVATNTCVDATLRDAFFRGFYVVVPEDAVGSHVPALHDATLRQVRMLYGDVTTVDTLARLWATVPAPNG